MCALCVCGREEGNLAGLGGEEHVPASHPPPPSFPLTSFFINLIYLFLSKKRKTFYPSTTQIKMAIIMHFPQLNMPCGLEKNSRHGNLAGGRRAGPAAADGRAAAAAAGRRRRHGWATVDGLTWMAGLAWLLAPGKWNWLPQGSLLMPKKKKQTDDRAAGLTLASLLYIPLHHHLILSSHLPRDIFKSNKTMAWWLWHGIFLFNFLS